MIIFCWILFFLDKKEATPPVEVDKKEKENTTPEKHGDVEMTESQPIDRGQPGKRRFKAKKQVKRTYEDEDGYIRMLTCFDTILYTHIDNIHYYYYRNRRWNSRV